MTSPFGAPAVGRGRDDACPGALRLHSADDGALARVRLPGGLLTAAQAEALARLSVELGDGHLDLTSRGNVQLRGLSPDAGGELGARLGAAGLLPSIRHERVRNVVASPLARLDGRGHADVQAWTHEVDALLCASDALTDLSGRFLFVLDDGRGDVAALGGDVTLIARPGGAAVLHVGPVAPDSGIAVPAEDGPRWVLRAAEEFLRLARGAGQRAWRVREVDPDGSRIRARLGGPQAPAEAVADCPPPAFGVVRDACGEGVGLSLGVRFGRSSARQWRLLATVAARGSGELRLTPWRGVVLPGLTAADALAASHELSEAGFITDPASPWQGASACTGLPGCAKSLADVRRDAADALAAQPPYDTPRLPVHWSGCERRCGHPGGRWVDVLATADGYQVTVHGTDRADLPGTQQTSAAIAAARSTLQTRTT
ncbi:precorrin-3B synthase [Streptantibioticus ferralitis]|uniref:Precorrin-3B synthase n=1 Tax=Streptantibioticus ferralitis TaxID=236510 RepID=A0ABT5YWD1_9ACTN|nr:precorrin-3B synthase [Streptantibioticus ferralitis]MDF2255907.1 precorrin-3B synthase [Streptantibioticus ferralitis]